MAEPVARVPVLPEDWGTPLFELVRVASASDLPPASPAALDVALLDMNHGYPNVGHDAMVAFLRDLSARYANELEASQRRVRVLSYAIRDRLMIPDHASGRHHLYLGTGGPGHLDPRRNTEDRGAAEGRAHPWFGKLLEDLPTSRLPVLESRYYDLIPTSATFPAGVSPIAFESGANGMPGEALTMLEFARRAGETAPRIFAVNSHPEIGTPERVQSLLERLLANGALTPEVFTQRSALLPVLRDDRREARLRVARAVFSDLIERRLEGLVRAA